MENQRTIEKQVNVSGMGLHTANKVNITFKPADVGCGINFIRVDLPGEPFVRADIDSVLAQTHSPRRTSVGKDDFEVQTIEHLMSALAGLGIDNINIEIDGNEVPGLDGSSQGFIDVLLKGGIRQQDKEKEYFSVKEPIFVEDGSSSLIALPSSSFKISYTMNYNHPFLKTHFLEISLNEESFRDNLASARTFCLEEEAEELQKQGLGGGANYENTLVVGKNGVIKNRLRFPDEFIRHKVLDLLGDLYLMGSSLKAHIIGIKSGHNLNLMLTKKLSEQKARYLLGSVSTGYQPKDEEALDITKIMKILPHRDPFLFVDKITTLEKGKHATGIKNVSINDYFFKGHFPGRPVMPGVIIVEALAQVGGVMMLSPDENHGKLAFFLAADNIKFRKTVIPGDQLVLDVVVGKIKSRTGQVHGKAYVDGKVVAEADLMFVLVDA